MEIEINSSFEVDEVKVLRDQIKNLTFENNLLRKQTQLGLSMKVPGVGPGLGLDSIDINLGSHAPSRSGDVHNDILIINDQDVADEETWLCIAKRQSTNSNANPTGVNLIKWLRSDVDDNHDYEFQVMRRSLVTRIEELQLGSKRNIDTRTFTRPKKQMSRPALRSVVDSPLFECREVLPSMPETMPESLTFSENIEDISMPFNSMYSSMSIHESRNSNDNFEMPEERDVTATFQQVENTRNIMFQKLEDSRLKNPSFGRSEDAKLNTLHAFQHDESHRLNTTITKILSEPHLNTTTELRLFAPSLGRLSLSPQKVSSQPDSLNLTFNKSDRLSKSRRSANNTVIRNMDTTFVRSEPDPLPLAANATFCNGPSKKRAASCDSINDDCSSTSDSSVNACHRLMNAGDVQHIARLQEESLHIAMSTPRSNDGKPTVFDEDLPSPIYSRVDAGHGYQSDHSDHSSVAKSSHSSQVSSPSNSLHGSNNMLAYDTNRRGLQVPKARPTAAPSRGTSGLRPPSSRPTHGGAVSGLPRPTTNIPRPQSSRIPAPKTRKPAESFPMSTKKSNWTDGCF